MSVTENGFAISSQEAKELSTIVCSIPNDKLILAITGLAVYTFYKTKIDINRNGIVIQKEAL